MNLPHAYLLAGGEIRRRVLSNSFPQLLLVLHLTQLYTANLARNRLGQAIHKLDLTWILVRGCDPLDVFLQFGLYLEWANAVACTDDHIICPPDEPEVAILVLVGAVSCDIPVATNAGLRCLRVAPVFPEHPDGTLWLHFDGYVTFFVRGKFVS